MAKKSTNAEVTLRVNQVYGLLSRGFSRAQILQYATEAWDSSERQTDTYIQRARQLIERDCDMSRPAFIAEALTRLRNYEQQAHDLKQPSVAIQSIQAQAKFIGIDANP